MAPQKLLNLVERSRGFLGIALLVILGRFRRRTRLYRSRGRLVADLGLTG